MQISHSPTLLKEAPPPHLAGPVTRPRERPDAPVTSDDQRVDDLLTTVTQCDGPTIQRLREARDVSQGQINLTTKISLSNLRFIEADDLDALSAPVYLRGYLRQYPDQSLGRPILGSETLVAGMSRDDIAGYMTRISTQSTHIR